MRSGAGAGPIPKTPFSEWKITSRSTGTWSATWVGAPMPRLTNQPSGMSRATRTAISVRVRGLYAVGASTFRSLGDGGLAIGHVQHALDVDAWRRDLLRIERAKIENVLRLRDRQLGRHRHHRIEVTRRGAVGQIAPAIGLPSLDQRHVAGKRLFQKISAAGNLALLLAGGELGADGGRGEERRDAGAG